MVVRPVVWVFLVFLVFLAFLVSYLISTTAAAIAVFLVILVHFVVSLISSLRPCIRRDSITGLFYGEGACILTSTLNQEVYKQRGKNLTQVAGSLGLGTRDPWYEFGGANFRTTDDFLSSKYSGMTSAGYMGMDAHMWLEDDQGRVYDIVTKHVVMTALHRSKTIAVQAGEVLAGVHKSELKRKGMIYKPATVEFRDWWIDHMKPHLAKLYAAAVK